MYPGGFATPREHAKNPEIMCFWGHFWTPFLRGIGGSGQAQTIKGQKSSGLSKRDQRGLGGVKNPSKSGDFGGSRPPKNMKKHVI